MATDNELNLLGDWIDLVIATTPEKQERRLSDKLAIFQRFSSKRSYSHLMSANNQMPCDFCQRSYDPIATRRLCPHCHMKTNCCDGAPCPMPDQLEITISTNRNSDFRALKR